MFIVTIELSEKPGGESRDDEVAKIFCCPPDG